MLPIGVRASICAKVLTSSNKSFSTSSCLAGKIYKSTRERPIISTYKVKDRTFRVEAAQPEDIPLLTDFMSEIAAEHEPSSISTGKLYIINPYLSFRNNCCRISSVCREICHRRNSLYDDFYGRGSCRCWRNCELHGN